MAFANYTEAANKLRDFLKDKEALNILEGVKENTDDDLIDYIKTTLIDINNTGFKTSFGLKDIASEPEDAGAIPWHLVKLGATLECLTSNGILSSRNTLTFSDAGNVTVQDFDKFGRFINYYNVLISKYMNGIQLLKMRINITNAYSGSHSPMQYDSYYL